MSIKMAEKDGLTYTVTVEFDGKVPGLSTGDTLTPPSALPLHARRPKKESPRLRLLTTFISNLFTEIRSEGGKEKQ